MSIKYKTEIHRDQYRFSFFLCVLLRYISKELLWNEQKEKRKGALLKYKNNFKIHLKQTKSKISDEYDND